MSALVLDAGALIALDRHDRGVWVLLAAAAADAGAIVQVPAGAIAQARRDGRRQALLSRALGQCDEVALDGSGARAAGLLCGRSGSADIVDASVVLTAAGLARNGPVAVLTSDPGGIRRLAMSFGASVEVVPV